MGDGPATAVIRFEGDLDVRRASELKGELTEALAGAVRLGIDLGGADTFDPSFPQLLCAVRREAVRQGKEVALEGELPERFRQRLAEAGFGCGALCSNGCLWEGRAGESRKRQKNEKELQR